MRLDDTDFNFKGNKDNYWVCDNCEATAFEELEDDDHCYECGGYGDDYGYDEETGELVSNCDNCSYNGDDDYEDD